MSAPNPKITLPEILPLVREYYARPGNESGGNFHVVLDDGNIERTHIFWCLRRAHEKRDWPGQMLGLKLLRLSVSQRKRLVRSRY